MEFTEIFSAFAILLVGIIAVGALITGYANTYGDVVGENTGQFTTTLSNVETTLGTGFVERGLDYSNSTQSEEGQGTSTDQQDNILKRALNTINLMRELIGLAPALIKDGSVALGLPEIYWKIGQALFWIIFSITLAYVLIVGARRLIG